MATYRCAALVALLALLLVTSSQAQRVAGSAELPQVLDASPAAAAASSSLLRGGQRALLGNRPVLSLNWNSMRGPMTRWVRAGSVVSFAWTRYGGLSYGYSRCRSAGTLKKACPRATVLVKIPRGRFWFFDNYRSQCNKAAIYIIGY
jgi:hypothetical protein